MIKGIRNKNSLLVILLYCIVFSPCLSQSNKPSEKEVIAISMGAGILTFHGDVGENSQAGPYSFIRSGFDLSIEKHLNKNIAVSLNFLKGKIARDEKASDNVQKLNFESPIHQLGLSGTLLIAGKNDPPLVPFLSIGLSALLFDPYGDLLDKKGDPYYYWKDGSLRDLPEAGLNYFYARILERDYKYETKLTDSSSYLRRTLVVPLASGIKMKITESIDVNVKLTYHLSFSDYLDNVKKTGLDAYLFSSASLTWHVFSLLKKDKEAASKLFAEMDVADSDKDGVPDANDLCQGTPKDVKIDSKGCPLDSDGDGVPDYTDKEPHSKNGVLVDAHGVEITKASLKEISKENKTAAASRKEAYNSDFNQKPGTEFLKQVEEIQKEKQKDTKSNKPHTAIPKELIIADWNKDGLITSDEIGKTIESFFDGTITFSVEQINKLIDFFFEQ